MKTNNLFFVVVASVLTACGVSIPQAENTSYETMTISKSDITLPLKYSATLKGTADVTITPQTSGQLRQAHWMFLQHMHSRVQCRNRWNMDS